MQIRRKLFLIIALIIVLGGVLTAEAGLSIIGGVNAGNGSITASGKIAGYGGDQNVTIRMQVDGVNVNTYCQNPGGKVVPGQPVDIYIDETHALSPDSNGSYLFNFHEEYLPTVEEAGCPNGNWSVLGLDGTLLVTFGAYEDGSATPSDELVYACEVNTNTIVECTQVQ